MSASILHPVAGPLPPLASSGNTGRPVGAVRHRTGGISGAGERDHDRWIRVARRLPRGGVSWRSSSSSSLWSSCWRSPLDRYWPCATLRRLTSSPQEPIQLTSRARSRTPARAPPSRPHPGIPKTNHRRPRTPPPLRLTWHVTILRIADRPAPVPGSCDRASAQDEAYGRSPAARVIRPPSARRYSASSGGWCTWNSQPGMASRNANHSRVSGWVCSRQVCSSIGSRSPA
jgi:hypothetical protein